MQPQPLMYLLTAANSCSWIFPRIRCTRLRWHLLQQKESGTTVIPFMEVLWSKNRLRGNFLCGWRKFIWSDVALAWISVMQVLTIKMLINPKVGSSLHIKHLGYQFICLRPLGIITYPLNSLVCKVDLLRADVLQIFPNRNTLTLNFKR